MVNTIQPATLTIGQKLDAELNAIKGFPHAALTDVESAGSKVAKWVGNNAVHVAGYGGIIAVLKHFV